MAIDESNTKGGVLGRKIVTVVEDSQCKADPAVNAANKVIDQDGVHYIIGEVYLQAHPFRFPRSPRPRRSFRSARPRPMMR